MKKLTLDPQALTVESYATAPQAEKLGTVKALESDSWSEWAPCPTTNTTECKRCPFPR
jgi:hypothetical protein